jgi:hypothetical protein
MGYVETTDRAEGIAGRDWRATFRQNQGKYPHDCQQMCSENVHILSAVEYAPNDTRERANMLEIRLTFRSRLCL